MQAADPHRIVRHGHRRQGHHDFDRRLVPGIRRFTAEGHIYRLVVSLNSADPGNAAS